MPASTAAITRLHDWRTRWPARREPCIAVLCGRRDAIVAEKVILKTDAGAKFFATPATIASAKKVWLFHHITVANSPDMGCNLLRGVGLNRGKVAF